MTSVDHQCGTDRIAEAITNIEADIIVNLQADEPEIEPENIDIVAKLLLDNPSADMATLVTGFDSKEQVENPNVVKAVVDKNSKALYFSRSIVPYNRDAAGVGDVSGYLRHLGIYAYRKDFLLEITQKARTPWEINEKLEQLRALEYGYTIMAAKVDQACEGIDTPEQYAAFVERISK
jgi:3-deoxy-manno-octulosonate cytidylyltransferase (CMP-KDO synthetase)